MKGTIMLATKAHHLLGDVSRTPEDWCCVQPQPVDGAFVGNWITGIGLINVRFPVETTRALTQEERERFDKLEFAL